MGIGMSDRDSGLAIGISDSRLAMRDERFPYCSVAISTARVNSTARPCQQVGHRATTKPRIYWRKRAYCRGRPKWPGVCDSGGERRGSDAAVSIKTTSTSIARLATMVAVPATLSSPWRRCGLPSWCVSSEVELRRDEKRVSSRITRNAMMLAMSALLFGAVNASAQSDIVLQASNTSARAGRWAVVSDSGAAGGAKIRHADAGAAKIDTAAASPANYFELTFTATAGVPLPPVGARQGRRTTTGATTRSSCSSLAASALGRRGLPHRHDLGDRSQPRGLQRLRPQRLEVAGQRVGHGRARPGRSTSRPPARRRMRVQTREDGLSIDQIILSPSTSREPTPPRSSQARPRQRDRRRPRRRSTAEGARLEHPPRRRHRRRLQHRPFIAARSSSSGANVVSLNEVEKNTGCYGNEDQPARYRVAAEVGDRQDLVLQVRAARRQHQRTGQPDAARRSRSRTRTATISSATRARWRASQIIVNGIRVNVFSTHLDADSSSRPRDADARAASRGPTSFAEQRIIAGDFNAWPGAGEISNMTSRLQRHLGARAEPATSTCLLGQHRRQHAQQPHRLRLALEERDAALKLKGSQVFDVRNSSGVAPSDHRPVMTTFEVK